MGKKTKLIIVNRLLAYFEGLKHRDKTHRLENYFPLRVIYFCNNFRIPPAVFFFLLSAKYHYVNNTLV